MVEAHETHEKISEAAHEHKSKRVAILITVLAALLALTETAGKSAQHASLASNIEASNLWAFFQAKTIRQTTVRTAADAFETLESEGLPTDRADAVAKRVAGWRATADRYESEPETQEGRRELVARAKAAEAERDHALAAYHHFEYGSAAFQLAIVLASASVVTGVTALTVGAGLLGLAGVIFGLLGWLAPTLLHF